MEGAGVGGGEGGGEERRGGGEEERRRGGGERGRREGEERREGGGIMRSGQLFKATFHAAYMIGHFNHATYWFEWLDPFCSKHRGDVKVHL